MSHKEIFSRLEIAIRKRDPRLACQLRPGLSVKARARWLKKVPGDTSVLAELYAWHDGTEPLRWSEGETHKMSLLELSLIPGEIFPFTDLETSATHFAGWATIARYHPRIVEAVGRYFPILWDGSGAWLTVDVQSGKHARVVHFEMQDDQPFREAYPTFDEFLLDVLKANETGEPLRVFREGLLG
ncbi:MAG: hypothetical protein QM691_16755 [Opitutaceae bacterium]